MADIHKAAGIIIQNRKILALRTRGKDTFVNPGGKLEAGETPTQALVRELREELQISVREEDLVAYGTYYSQAAYDPEKSLQLDAFIVKVWSGQLVPDNEIEEMQWISSSLPEGMQIASIMEHDLLPKLKQVGLIE